MKEEEEHIKKAEAAKRSAVDDSHSLGERRVRSVTSAFGSAR